MRGREGVRNNFPKGPTSQRLLQVLTSSHTVGQGSNTWGLEGTHGLTTPPSEANTAQVSFSLITICLKFKPKCTCTLSFYWLNLATPSREDLFEVDPNSGNVTVKNGTLLDREKQAMYYLTMQATDGGNQSTTTMLQITLLDVNDNPPVVRGSYNIFVPEEDGNVSVTIQVRAALDLVREVEEGTVLPLREVSALHYGSEEVAQFLWASISS